MTQCPTPPPFGPLDPQMTFWACLWWVAVCLWLTLFARRHYELAKAEESV